MFGEALFNGLDSQLARHLYRGSWECDVQYISHIVVEVGSRRNLKLNIVEIHSWLICRVYGPVTSSGEKKNVGSRPTFGW